MGTLVWSRRLFTGVDTLDQQHESMLALAQALRRQLTTTSRGGSALPLFERLIAETQFHFAVEESLMRFFAYPRYAEHQAVHETILAEAERLRTEYSRGACLAGWKTAKFIDDWVVAHIAQSDTHFATTVQSSL